MNIYKIKRSYFKIKKAIFIIFLIILIFSSTGCIYKSTEYTRATFIFDTYATITIYESDSDKTNSQICDEAVDILNKLDDDLSVTKPESELNKINHNAFNNPYVTKEYIYNIIKICADIGNQTDGLLDITLGKIMKLYGFRNKTTPQLDLIGSYAGKQNYKNIKFNDNKNSIRFTTNDFEIDLGAITKGYALEQVSDFLSGNGVKEAVIDLGGSIKTIGDKEYTVGVTYDETDNPYAKVKIKNQYISTSNGLKRFVKYDGKTYHHIIDGKTALPADNEIQSVTVISDNGMLSDILSTTFYVGGKEKTDELADLFTECQFMIKFKDGSYRFSENLKEKIILN